ncbi:MAG: AAA family ATPase [Candidatus Paceibacterota bacterium]|jgi:predicted ATP-dependent endonuclease of OLD family
MYISHAKISNFRALQEVDVPLNKCSILLGENDVGKTSFLLALDRFFANKKISDEEDFFNRDTSADITLTLTFSDLPTDPTLDSIQKADGTITVRKTFSFNETPDTKAIMDDSSTKAVDKSILNDLLSSDAFHFIPVRRDLSVQFSMTKTSLLGKTLRVRMHEAIKNNDADQSLGKVEQLLVEAIKGPQEELQAFLREQMHNEDMRLVFDALNVDPIEGVSFKVKLGDDKIEDILVENRGAGTQNNLIIALFRLVAGLHVEGKLIFAMEEPENSLHPKAQRQLFSVLQEVSEKSQVIITTHSPVFLERSSFENNIILTRTAKGNTVAKVFDHTQLEELRTDLGIRPSDALLKGGGNCAILVEGNTEEEAYPIFMEMLGLSEFKLGIAIVNMRGSDTSLVSNTARLLGAYDIPCVVVLDQDAKATADDIVRESNAGLKNVKKVFCLTQGTMEDYYPLDIVAEVINQSFNPTQAVVVADFDDSKHGADRLSDFKKVMYEKGLGKSLGYLKRLIGSNGTKIMKEKGLPVPEELAGVFAEVVKIVNEGV